MNYRDDSILAKGIKEGDEQSFEKLYWKYHKQLYGIAFKYLRSQDLAEDAVQDIFLKLWSKRGDIDPSRSLKDFLFTMLKNHVLNMIRNNQRRILKNLKFSLQKKTPEYVDDELALNMDYEKIVEDGLMKLSEGKREIFKMHCLEGKSNNEIASELRISVFTVKTQLYHANKFIRDYLKLHA